MSWVRDGDWELVEFNAALKRSIWTYFDGERQHWRTTYEADAILDANAEALAASSGQRFGDWRRVASVPLNVYYDELEVAQREGDDRFVARWLNDGDHSRFRTFGGKL